MKTLIRLISFTTLLFALSCQSHVPSGFVLISDIDPSIKVEMLYNTNHNFIGQPIDGYKDNKCYLTKEAAHALAKVQKTALEQNYTLKVYDCFRPQRAVNHFMSWAKNTNDTKMKTIFYPSTEKSRLFVEGYIAEKSGHSRGSTVDITLVPLSSDNPPFSFVKKRCDDFEHDFASDGSLYMGTDYDCFSPLSSTMNIDVPANAQAHRLLLKHLMERYGFRNYDKEWWHFTLANEPFPETYFDFVVR